MSRHPDLSGQNTVILDNGTAGYPALRNKDTIFSNPDIVGNLHQVVNLGSLPNHCLIKPSPINGHVGPNFNILFDHNRANLRNLLIDSIDLVESETVSPYHSTAMNDDPVSNGDPLSNTHVGIDQTSSPDDRLSTDKTTAFNNRPVPDLNLTFNDRERSNADTFADLSIPGNQGLRVNPHRPLHATLHTQTHGARKRQRRVLNSNNRFVLGIKLERNDDRRSLGRLSRSKILRIRDKGQVPCLRFLNTGNASYDNIRITDDLTANGLGDLGQFFLHNNSPIIRSRKNGQDPTPRYFLL